MARILIVDDAEENLLVLGLLLHSRSHEVSRARDGREALAEVERFRPELIISDILMPGMDGFSLCRALKNDERFRDIPLIFYTATYTDREDEALGLRLGADLFVHKPAESEFFLQQVHEVLERSRAAAGKRTGTSGRSGPHLETEEWLREYAGALGRKIEDKLIEVEQARQVLQAQERFMRAVLHSLWSFVVVLDGEGKVLWANCPDESFDVGGYLKALPRHQEGANYLAEFRSCSDLGPAEAERCALECERVCRGQTPRFETEYTMRFRDEDRWLLVRATALSVPSGGAVVVYDDITRRKRAEEAMLILNRQLRASEAGLRQQQKLEAVGTLAGGVAHEINNPITSIINYGELILDHEPPDSQTARDAAAIVSEAERVAKVVRSLLLFARRDPQSSNAARVEDIVNSTLVLIQTVIRADHIALETDVPPGLPDLRCRSQEIRQVLMNLLSNARDALNDRYLGFHEDKLIRVQCRLFEQEGKKWIRFTVEDHGPGIVPEICERIFDPFFSTKPKDRGTGLGLSVSHGIVKDHHGKLHFESRPGEWTKFHMDLPIDAGESDLVSCDRD